MVTLTRRGNAAIPGALPWSTFASGANGQIRARPFTATTTGAYSATRAVAKCPATAAPSTSAPNRSLSPACCRRAKRVITFSNWPRPVTRRRRPLWTCCARVTSSRSSPGRDAPTWPAPPVPRPGPPTRNAASTTCWAGCLSASLRPGCGWSPRCLTWGRCARTRIGASSWCCAMRASGSFSDRRSAMLPGFHSATGRRGRTSCFSFPIEPCCRYVSWAATCVPCTRCRRPRFGWSQAGAR